MFEMVNEDWKVFLIDRWKLCWDDPAIWKRFAREISINILYIRQVLECRSDYTVHGYRCGCTATAELPVSQCYHRTPPSVIHPTRIFIRIGCRSISVQERITFKARLIRPLVSVARTFVARQASRTARMTVASIHRHHLLTIFPNPDTVSFFVRYMFFYLIEHLCRQVFFSILLKFKITLSLKK